MLPLPGMAMLGSFEASKAQGKMVEERCGGVGHFVRPWARQEELPVQCGGVNVVSAGIWPCCTRDSVATPTEFPSPSPWNSHPRARGAGPAQVGPTPGSWGSSPPAPATSPRLQNQSVAAPRCCLCWGWRSTQTLGWRRVGKEFRRGKSAWVMLGLARCYATPCGNHGNAQQPVQPFSGTEIGNWDPGGFSHRPEHGLSSPNVSQYPKGLLLQLQLGWFCFAVIP